MVQKCRESKDLIIAGLAAGRVDMPVLSELAIPQDIHWRQIGRVKSTAVADLPGASSLDSILADRDQMILADRDQLPDERDERGEPV
jgi:hypothetical protein